MISPKNSGVMTNLRIMRVVPIFRKKKTVSDVNPMVWYAFYDGSNLHCVPARIFKYMHSINVRNMFNLRISERLN